MTYPPGRMFHVFEDAFFDHAETKAERLLYAAIDYCTERSIVYVAAKPPRSEARQLGASDGPQIVYLPDRAALAFDATKDSGLPRARRTRRPRVRGRLHRHAETPCG